MINSLIELKLSRAALDLIQIPSKIRDNSKYYS